jgi:multiple sugar transport system substrate-binding protein
MISRPTRPCDRRDFLSRMASAAVGLPALGLLVACGAPTASTPSVVSSSAAVNATAASVTTAAMTSASVALTSSQATGVASASVSTAAGPTATTATSASASVAPSSQAAQRAAAQVSISTDWLSGPRGEVMKSVIPEFQRQHPDVKIVEEPITGNYWDTVATLFASDTIADVLLADGYFFSVFRDSGGFVPIDSYLKENGVDLQAYSVVPGVASFGGKLYGMPSQLVVSGWYYNVDLFQADGVKPPDESWTWDDVLAAAQKLTDPSKNQYGMLVTNSDEFVWGPLVFSNGGNWRNADNTKCALTDNQGAEAFQWVIDLIFKYKVAPTMDALKTLDTTYHNDPFSYGKVAMMPTGYQGIGARMMAKENWGLMPTPKSPTTKNAFNEWNDQPYYVTSGAQKRNLVPQAAALAMFMGSPFAQGQIAVSRGSVPTVKLLQTGPAYLKPPPTNMLQVSKNLAAPQLLVAPYIFRQGHDFETAMTTEIQKAFTGEKSAADALRDAVSAASAVLAAKS